MRLVSFYQVRATAYRPGPAPLVYSAWTIPDFMYNTHVERGTLGIVLQHELPEMQRQVVELGADPANIFWRCFKTVTYDLDKEAP